MTELERILNTVYHDSTINYVSNPYPKKGEEFEIKLRLKTNDLVTGVYIRYRYLGEDRIQNLELSYEKNGLSYFTTKVKCLEDVFSYYFHITTKDTIYSYNQAELVDYRVDSSRNFRILMDYDAPKWTASTVFYQIMPDRFCNSRPDITIKPGAFTYQNSQPTNHAWDEIPEEWDKAKCMDFYGGDLYGVMEKLDYLQELGVNAIYFNPLFTSPTIHKYDALDYFEIDPSFGGDEALAALSEEMHKRGMKLILDISINHTSSSSKWFNKDGIFYDKSIGAYNNPDSEEREFYFINEDGSYLCWAGVETMPALNYGSEKLRKIIYKDENSVLKKYLKAPFNIDGWRFDVADVMARNEVLNVYNEVWEEIYQEIKKTNKDALILAEEWQDATEMFNGKRWDSTMNYFSSELPIREFAGERDVFTMRHPELSKINYSFNAEQLKNRIEQFYNKQAGQVQYQMFNLIDSHDVTRLYNNPEIDYEVYKGAVYTLFGLPGSTNVYYGDEKHLDGRIISIEGARYPMDWSDSLEGKKKEMFEVYKKLTKLKTENPAYGFGGFKILYARGPVFVFARFTEDELFITSWSKSDKEECVEIDIEAFGLKEKLEVILGQVESEINENTLKLTIPAIVSSIVKIS